MQICQDDPAREDVRALLEEHLRNMRELSPPESVHALDIDGLKAEGVSFWTARKEGLLLGCAALKQLDPRHGEIKSMRTPERLRRLGTGRALLDHLIYEARARGVERLSLETGSMDEFLPARRLYERFGFVACPPFGDYQADPNSVFMTLVLSPPSAHQSNV